MTAAAVTVDPLSPQVLEKNAVEMLERDRWSREKLDEFQDRRLRRLLEHAVERSPYYREALGEDAAEAPLGDLPTLPKSLLLNQFDRVVTDPRLRRRDLEGFLGAADAGELYHDEYRIFSTSGTRGLSGLFAYSQSEFAHWVAVFLRSLSPGCAPRRPGWSASGRPARSICPARSPQPSRRGIRGAPRLAVTTPSRRWSPPSTGIDRR